MDLLITADNNGSDDRCAADEQLSSLCTALQRSTKLMIFAVTFLISIFCLSSDRNIS